MTTSKEISVIIPAYNEEKRIGRSLMRISDYLAGNWEYEILVVDDGSTDGTTTLVQKVASSCPSVHLIRNAHNRGKGHAVRCGMLSATKRLRLLCDADLSTPIEELRILYPYIKEGYDIVIGSRALPDSRIEVRQSLPREILGKAFNLGVRFLFDEKIRDTQCGFKLYTERGSALFRLQQIDGFAFDVETLVLARLLCIPLTEAGVRWRNDPDSRVDMFHTPIQMTGELIRLRRNLSRGLYRHSAVK